nr:hypothetical protein [Tanacetum cinerariifolium]
MNQNQIGRTVLDIDEETDAFYLQKAIEYHKWLLQQESQPRLTRTPIFRYREDTERRLRADYFDDHWKRHSFWFLRFGSCVLSLVFCLLRFDSCVLVLRFGPAFCLVEDFYCVLLRRDSAQLKTSLRFVSKVGYVLLQDKLRFASRQVVFCLKTRCVLPHDTLSHLNFDYINLLSKKDIVIGLPKLKFAKDQLCSSCELSKAKRSSFKSKVVPSLKGRLNLLHMDLCGPMRVASLNGKKNILVIVDEYSRYTWTLFLHSKDETPKVLKEFLTMIQRNIQALVITVRTDRGTEFLNKTLNAFFKEERIEHQTFTARTPEQNDVVERRNHTLVETARMMLSASKLPLFFWAEAIATACYTQNRSIIISTRDKMAYHIINDRKPLIKHLHIFGCICYITRDGENLDKMKEKGGPCIL